MDIVGNLIVVFISIALVNNLVLTKFLGICPYLGVSRRVEMAFGMGCAVTFVITISATVTWLINHLILEPINMPYLKYIAFIMHKMVSHKFHLDFWKHRCSVIKHHRNRFIFNQFRYDAGIHSIYIPVSHNNRHAEHRIRMWSKMQSRQVEYTVIFIGYCLNFIQHCHLVGF